MGGSPGNETETDTLHMFSMDPGTLVVTWTVMLWVTETLPWSEVILTCGMGDSDPCDATIGPEHPGII